MYPPGADALIGVEFFGVHGVGIPAGVEVTPDDRAVGTLNAEGFDLMGVAFLILL